MCETVDEETEESEEIFPLSDPDIDWLFKNCPLRKKLIVDACSRESTNEKFCSRGRFQCFTLLPSYFQLSNTWNVQVCHQAIRWC